jgi:Protein of unknown function (DUF1566)
MNRRNAYAGGVIGIAFSLITAGAFAATAVVGPYYATPSWDQTLPSSTRFIVLSNFNNEAVLDRETGLVWERSPRFMHNWYLASSNCIGLTTGGRLGWRLPTIQELGSLFDPTARSGPPLPSGNPFLGIPAADYTSFWSATQDDFDGVFAFVMTWFTSPSTHAFTVDVTGTAFKSGPFSLGWCVRGGLQSQAQ